MMSRILLIFTLALPLAAATETLRYTINWASGLSLGEASLISDNADAGSAAQRKHELRLEASVPGFAVLDEVKSTAKPDFCLVRLEKKLKHGSRLSDETMEVLPAENAVERKTAKGGSTKIPVAGCVRDALSFIYFLRQEIKAGRVPQGQRVYFGSPYQLDIKYVGVQSLNVAGGSEPADKFQVLIQGPLAKHNLEVFFGRDTERTPLLFRLPLILGTFSMELQR
jgi:hypothetical protein